MIALLRTYLRPYQRQLFVVCVLLLIQAIANLYLPTLNADIINNGVVKGDTDYIVRIGALMLVVTFLLAVAAIVAVYFSARIAMAFGRDVRSDIFRAVQTFSQAEVNRFGTPSLITRNTNDVQQVQMVVLMGLTVMISAPITAVGGIILAIRQDVPLSAILIVILPIMAIFIGTLLRQAVPLFQSLQVKIDRINQVMRETLAGVRVIRAFVRTRHEEARFDVASLDVMTTSLRVNRLFAIMLPGLMVILNLSTVAILWFGAARVDSGEMPIGNLTAFLQYVLLILFSVLQAVIMFIFVPRGAVSAGRIQEVLQAEPSVSRPAVAAAVSKPAGRVEFRDVEFRYPGAEDPVLHGISFSAGPGETTAIIGSTGSGKSTLISLIPRLYDVTGGSILVDGIDIRSMEPEDLWAAIGTVPQKAFLFNGTVASNLRFGDADATDEQLWHALEVAQAKAFVEEMEGGLEAPIAQGGSNVSGGQRQRLAIARAIVKRPPIFLFDDSFSALDFKTDALLRAALQRETRTATVLIVAQRVGTVMNADRIIVLDNGTIDAIGTHAELMKTSETYREIVYSQLSEEEAA